MSFSIRGKNLSPIELLYEELKKQSAIDQNNSQAQNGSKESKATEINDEVTLSSEQLEAVEDPAKRKPSQPVTADEMHALRTQFSVYA